MAIFNWASKALKTQRILGTLLLFSFFFFSAQPVALSASYQGRLGLGFTNQLVSGLPALSFKLQKSSTFALGGLASIDTDETSGGFGVGLKIYRLLFDEPQLTFYGSVLGAFIGQKDSTKETQSGFQFDFTLGTEFSFRGMESLGFSLEFGVSLNKIKDFVIQTTGHHFITAGVHFYL